MIYHEPDNYFCPFCNFLAGNTTESNSPDDIVYQNKYATAFVAPKQWVSNPAQVLVIPNAHFENIYNIPDTYLAEVYKVVKKVAIAVRATYDCEGTSTRQHNEPAGDQDVWHLHVHVFPRYKDDNLYQRHEERLFADAAARKPYVTKLREYFAAHKA